MADVLNLDDITLDTLEEKEVVDEPEEKEVVADPEEKEEKEEKEDGADDIDVDDDKLDLDDDDDDEIDIDIKEYVKDDYKELEELGVTIDDKLEAEISELLEDGFSPEQINKLYKRAITKKNGGKEPVVETSQEASARLNKELTKDAKKNYKEITKLIEEVYPDANKEDLKRMKRSTALIEDFNKIREVLLGKEGIDINEARVAGRKKPSNKITPEQAIDKYHELQGKSSTREEQEKARTKIAKMLGEKEREKFLEETYTFDPKKAW